jgi:hypothetical protein
MWESHCQFIDFIALIFISIYLFLFFLAYRFGSFSFCSFLHSDFDYCVLGLNVPFIALLSDTINLSEVREDFGLTRCDTA